MKTMTPERLKRYRVQSKYVSDDWRTVNHDKVTRAWDYGRIRHFFEELKAGRPVDPIMLDNVCSGMHIYPEPALIDGHHRLAASWLAKVPTIPAHYSGRVDLLEYLTGVRQVAPAA